MSTNLKLEQEKDPEKERLGGRPKKLNEKKGDRDLEWEIKNKGEIFCWKNNMKILWRPWQNEQCRAKCFLLIRLIIVFHRCPALPSPLRITRFYILFEQATNIIESFAFSPGQIYILINLNALSLIQML